MIFPNTNEVSPYANFDLIVENIKITFFFLQLIHVDVGNLPELLILVVSRKKNVNNFQHNNAFLFRFTHLHGVTQCES